MSGIDWLLDTNFILGLLKGAPDTLALVDVHRVHARRCGYSAITRMELLGFPGLSVLEGELIGRKLASLVYIPLTPVIEDETIRLRCSYRIKLPDAIIVASALVTGAQLLTHDKALLATVNAELVRGRPGS